MSYLSLKHWHLINWMNEGSWLSLLGLKTKYKLVYLEPNFLCLSSFFHSLSNASLSTVHKLQIIKSLFWTTLSARWEKTAWVVKVAEPGGFERWEVERSARCGQSCREESHRSTHPRTHTNWSAPWQSEGCMVNQTWRPTEIRPQARWTDDCVTARSHNHTLSRTHTHRSPKPVKLPFPCPWEWLRVSDDTHTFVLLMQRCLLL